MPKWSTPARQARLVELFRENVNKCLQGHERCADPLHYERGESEMRHKGRRGQPSWSWTRTELEHVRVEGYSGATVKTTEWDAWVVTPERHDFTAVYENRYQAEEQAQVAHWVKDDRDNERLDRQEYEARLHDLGEAQQFKHQVFSPNRPPFDPVTADRFYDRRPEYYLRSIGVSTDLHKLAIVRVPSTVNRLHVELPTRLSRNARRKLQRYGQAPKTLSPQEHAIVRGAVQAWRKRVGLD